jgi:hypothetical protein
MTFSLISSHEKRENSLMIIAQQCVINDQNNRTKHHKTPSTVRHIKDKSSQQIQSVADETYTQF